MQPKIYLEPDHEQHGGTSLRGGHSGSRREESTVKHSGEQRREHPSVICGPVDGFVISLSPQAVRKVQISNEDTNICPSQSGADDHNDGNKNQNGGSSTSSSNTNKNKNGSGGGGGGGGEGVPASHQGNHNSRGKQNLGY